MKLLLATIEVIRKQAVDRIATRGKDGIYILKYEDAVAFQKHVASGGDPLALAGFEMLSEHSAFGMTPVEFADYVITKRAEWKAKIAKIELLSSQAKVIIEAAGSDEPSAEVLAIVDQIRLA